MYTLKNKFYVIIIFIFDLIGTTITMPFGLFRVRMPKDIRKILVIRLDHIGDTIFATPAFHAIKEAYPSARLDVLVNKQSKDVVKNNPHIDRIMTYDAPWFKQKNRRLIKLKEFLRLAKALRGEKYDVGIDLRGDSRHIVLMLLAAIRYRIGYGITGCGFLLNKEVGFRPNVHEFEHNLDILRAVGIRAVYKKSELFITDEHETFAKEFYTNNGLSEKDFVVCIHSGAGYPSKRWLPKKWAQLINALRQQFNAEIVIIGTKDDKTVSDNIKEIAKTKVIDAVGKTTLNGLAALLKKANLFIGTDSGPSHIAAAVDTPSVILYSGTNDARQWAPLGKKIIIIQKELPCRECEKLKCANNVCMDLITVNEVMEAAKKCASVSMQG